MKVVIADDIKNVCEGIKMLINDVFPELTVDGVFTDSTALIEYLENNTPDLLITDVCMPGFDGLDACEKLRERSSNAKIILITAYQDFQNARRAIQYQVQDLLVKPYTSEDLINAINTALNTEIKSIANDFATAVVSLDIKPFISKHSARLKTFSQTQSQMLFNETNLLLETNIEITNEELDDITSALYLYTKKYTNTDTRKSLVLRAKNYINKNYSDSSLSQSSIANALSVSAAYLSNVFGTEYGVNMTQYIAKTRINAAKELLAKGEKTIDNIAIAVGFTSTSYFYHTFKKETNFTPADYQKRIMKHEEK